MDSQWNWFRYTVGCGIVAGMSLISPSSSPAQEQTDRRAVPPRIAATQDLAGLHAIKATTTPDMPTGVQNGENRPQGTIGQPAAEQPKLLRPVEATTKPVEPPKSAWLTHPEYRRIPRLGNFPLLPTGVGYYSFADWLVGNLRETPPKSGYPRFALMPPSFFDADFRYVDDPNYHPDRLEELHRIHLGDNWLFATGGQAWWRAMHKTSSRLTGKNNSYDLTRVRVFGDVWYKDTFRIYGEFLTAHTTNQDLPPLRIDENMADIQNLFIDLKIGEHDGHSVYLRVGRQELLIGSQRLITPADWANTRRTFQGVRAFWSNDHFDVDLFWVNPVIPNSSGRSSIDDNLNFAGARVTYRPQQTQAIDTYYLFLDDSDKATIAGLTIAPISLHTLGSRYYGDKDGFLWDLEGMVQMGDRGGHSICAGAATAGIGYNAKELPMNPTVWAYYDWASGDHSPNSGGYNTFNQLFPFGHYYFGFLDLVGRQNIRDWNAQIYLYPTKWITFNAQYHFFSLDSARDALYNAAGIPTRARLNGSAGGQVGQELDLLANIHLDKRSDILVGWSKMNAGDFIRNTGNGRSPELFYLMYNVRW